MAKSARRLYLYKKKIRLSKLMASRGICSRREADVYIERGLVRVDGEIISELGTRVFPNVKIELLPAAQQRQEETVTILLNKPIGFVATQPEDGYVAAVTLITRDNLVESPRERFRAYHLNKLAVCGRLDIDSSGLLLLTQDGTIARCIIGEDHTMEKERKGSERGQAWHSGI